jgi:hypothetical protein
MILFGASVNTLVLSLLAYADFFGWFRGMTTSGFLYLDYLIISSLGVVGFLFVLIGMIRLLRGRGIKA